MILFLTYHKVLENAGQGGEDFYTVSRAELEHQLELLRVHSFERITIDELVKRGPVPGSAFILSFDDGTSDHYDVVFPLLQKHRCQGVFSIPTAKLNKPGYLAVAQVREMAAAGHAFGCHSHEHRRLDLLSMEEIRLQISQAQQILGDILGRPPVLLVPPGGFVNDRVRRVARDLGLRIIRTMHWGYNKQPDLMALETIPINQHTTDQKFLRILQFREKPVLYAAKETLKWLLPSRSYEGLRRLLFKMSKSH